ncbi:serine/threonine protein kinase [Candidatus Uabimicrobium amorphum]|uniref:non-specific serine/threonine protein kinase n=1 Tax=Uabimicrobium amorphum TaxID=2596890 RepID=A0A5S9F4W6_UABAM|nr:WD40 repeat domain-containing serine/threonine protein kinase [Candidatus Uabimicrobium amorphum]BBM85029.1 protein kinase [Candidatus Uabimicrobium amorphum]
MKKIVCMCGKKIRVYEKTLGKNGKCPRCNRVITISANIWKNSPEVHEINDYSVIREISRGHIGIVYEVIDKEEKRFAIKIAYSRDENEMLEREYNLLKDISHKNIVCYHKIAKYKERLFVVMDFIDGKSLQDILLGLPGQLPVIICLQIAQTLAKTLGYLHAKKIIHCNIKPSNVLFTSNYDLVVINFSIAHTANSDLLIPTEFGSSPRYSAPEQRLHRKVQPQNDIYSIGCVLFELLTGESVVQDEDLLKSQHIFYSSPHAINASIPQEINTICRKAIHQDQEKRYSSTTPLVYDIESYIGNSCDPLSLQLQKFFNEFTFEEPIQSLNPQVTVENEFAHFRILQYFHRDHYGVVYKALDTHNNKIITLKVLLNADDTKNKEFRDTFHEIKKQRHPHIAKITSYGVSPQKYYSTEYLWGQPLTKLIGTTKYRKLAKIFYKIATTLHFMHETTVHGGLHPQSILITDDLSPKIIDFGLSSFYSPQRFLQDSMLCYTSPQLLEEQVVTQHDDIYAFGAILYHLLTKRPPFEGEDSTVMRQIRTTAAVPLCQINPDIPNELEYICLKCLHKNPEERYATAELVALDLQKFMENKPLYNEPQRKIPIARVGVAALFLLLTVILAVNHWRNAQKINTLQQQLTANIYEKAHTLYQQKKWQQAQILAKKIADIDNGKYKSAAQHIMQKSHMNQQLQWRIPHNFQQIKFSLKGNVLGAMKGEECFIIDSQTGTILQRHTFAKQILHITFAVNDEVIIFLADNTCQIWNYKNKNIYKKTRNFPRILDCEGKILAYAKEQQLCLFDLHNWKEIVCWDTTSSHLKMSPHGKYIAFNDKNHVEIWNVAEQVQLYSDNNSTCLALSNQLFALYNKEYVSLYNLETQEQLQHIYINDLVAAKISPDSKHLMLITRNTIKVYNITCRLVEYQFANAKECAYHPTKNAWVAVGKDCSYIHHEYSLTLTTEKIALTKSTPTNTIREFHPHMKFYEKAPQKNLAIAIEHNIAFLWNTIENKVLFSVPIFVDDIHIEKCGWLSETQFVMETHTKNICVNLHEIQKHKKQ